MKRALTQCFVVAGIAAVVAAIALPLIAGAPTSYLVGTPVLATMTNGSATAPWNLFQGDPGLAVYASVPPGTVLPTYTPGGATAAGEPNLAVYPGASSGMDGNSPYPSGTVGTPGPLAGYCGTGNNAAEAVGTPARQPGGTTLPLAPAYFPHVLRNGDGSLTGYFDYRPKDADEAIVAGRSTDNGVHWTYESEALEQNPGYCPNADINDDGEGHANVIAVNGVARLYTLQRAAGDNVGVGMLVHALNPTSSDPLNGLPAVEKVGVNPNNFASSAVTINATAATIPLAQPISTDPTNPEQLVVGKFLDVTATPTPSQTSVITCTGINSGTPSLTGCTTTATPGINVAIGDLIEQVIATISSGTSTVPSGPNTTTGDGGIGTLNVTVTNSGNLTMAILNANAPYRAYINGSPIYCSQSNAFPTNKIENCTTGPGAAALTVHTGDLLTSDPIVPATAQQTAGLVAPDGIVGVLPSFPNDGTVPGGAVYVMYTEKILNYYDVGFTGSKTTFASVTGANTFPFTRFPNSGSASLQNGSNTISLGDLTTSTIVQVTCTGLTGTTLSGCSTGAAGSDQIDKNSYIGAPGAATVDGATLAKIGEGSTSKAQKLLKNNEDLTTLRVAYTTDGVNFSSVGLDNNGVISGASGGVSNYTDINNPSSTTSPANLNAYAAQGTALAIEMRFVGSAGTILTNPDGSDGLFLSGAWAADGDSDAYNQIFYSTSTDGEHWSIPVSVLSTDYTFAASVAQDAALAASHDVPLGISAYYSGRAYGPSVVPNTDGTLTMVFAGYRLPAPAGVAGSVYGTNPSALYTIGATDPALYRTILAVTLPTIVSPDQIAVTASGLAFSRASQTYNGTVTLKNTSGSSLNIPLQLFFTNMPAGVTVVNPNGTLNGASYVTIPVASLAPGQSTSVAVQFKNSGTLATTFTPVVYKGSLQ